MLAQIHSAEPMPIRVHGRRLLGEVRSVTELDPAQRERMFELMHGHFEAVDRDRFGRDLDEKQWVLCLSCVETGVLQGFSTAMAVDLELDGQPVRALFSGDTIIQREYWGERTVGKLWLRFALDQHRRRDGRRLYWFLISMGHRTYRLLRIFFDSYWPRRDQETPTFERQLIDALAGRKFGDRYDPQRGVVVHEPGSERLRPDVAQIPEKKTQDRDIAFFLRRNPGWERGDELACLTEIAPGNIRRSARRAFQLEDLVPARGA